jgi:hypothetical protein
MTTLIRNLFRSLSDEWHREDTTRMKQIAWRYSNRVSMDGAVVKRTGAVIPKESA